MSQRRFYVPAGDKDDLLVTAFYRFLEAHSRTTVDDDGLCSMRSEFEGSLEVRVLNFWSERAASDFVLFWQDFRRLHSLSAPARPAEAATAE